MLNIRAFHPPLAFQSLKLGLSVTQRLCERKVIASMSHAGIGNVNMVTIAMSNHACTTRAGPTNRMDPERVELRGLQLGV